jgi:hypothetical protein
MLLVKARIEVLRARTEALDARTEVLKARTEALEARIEVLRESQLSVKVRMPSPGAGIIISVFRYASLHFCGRNINTSCVRIDTLKLFFLILQWKRLILQ